MLNLCAYLTLVVVVTASGAIARLEGNTPGASATGVTATQGRPIVHYALAVTLLAVSGAIVAIQVSTKPRMLTLKEPRDYLWAAFMVYWSVQFVRGMIGNPFAVSNVSYIVSATVITAIYVSRQGTYADFYRCFRNSIWLLSVAFVALLSVAPHYIAQAGYSGIVPGTAFRLHGLSHANQTSWMFTIYWLLNRPREGGDGNIVIRLLLDGLSLAVILLSQSKTAIALLAVGYLAKAVFMMTNGWGVKRQLLSLFCLTSGGAALWHFSEIGTLLSDAVSRFSGIGASSLETFTGRTKLWEEVLTDWHQSPWFGYGGNSWRDLMAHLRIDDGVALNAHNQYLQILWEAGIVGLVTYAPVCILMVICAFRSDASVRTGLVIAVVFLLLHGISESDVPLLYPIQPVFETYCTVFCLLCASPDAVDKSALSRGGRG